MFSLTDSPTGKVFGYPASTDDQAISVDSENYVIPECPLLSSLPVSCEEHAKESTGMKECHTNGMSKQSKYLPDERVFMYA